MHVSLRPLTVTLSSAYRISFGGHSTAYASLITARERCGVADIALTPRSPSCSATNGELLGRIPPHGTGARGGPGLLPNLSDSRAQLGFVGDLPRSDLHAAGG